MRRRLAGLALLAAAACGKGEGPTPQPAASAATSAATPPEASQLDAILSAEHRRDASSVTEADLQSRDAAVRRAAARALSRIGGPGARPGLLRALADEDDEVVAWAAYGLGFFCKGQEKATVSALAARFVARMAARPVTMGDPERVPQTPPTAEGGLDPLAAIARAVGRCGAEESEPTLVAWLAGPPAQATAAAFGLGELGTAKQKLREETLVALLNLAAGSAATPPLPEALFPVGRLEHLPPSVLDRVHDVAALRLNTPGDARLFAVRALARAGGGGVSELARVIATPGSFTASERAEAARGLGKHGAHGQRALASTVAGLVPANDPVSLTTLVGEDFGVLTTVLETLTDAKGAKTALESLSALLPPEGAPPTLVRRVSILRCHAARLLATPGEQDKRLLACDLTNPAAGIGARAMVAVLGKAEITGHRLALFRDLAQKGDIRAREAALELLEQHEEIEGAAAILAEALAAKEIGIVGTAAEVLTKRPQLAVADAPPKKAAKKPRKKKDTAAPEARAPSPAIVKALLDALALPAMLEDPEAADAIVDAVGALALKEARPRLDELCRSPYPTTREHVEKAIALISGEKKTCEAPAGGSPAPEELGHLVRAATTLSLDTDAGALELTLDPARAPVAVTRFVDLAKAGYYDGMIVHRVVPGFVAQFGAPFGDGFGGPPGKPALRCETSPLPFGPLAVGVALAGRDTGSSQLFVMHGRHPHLDGSYALVGKASGPWASLTEGDVIRKVKIGL